MNASVRGLELSTGRPREVAFRVGETLEVERWFATLGDAIDDGHGRDGETKVYILTARGSGEEEHFTVRRIELPDGREPDGETHLSYSLIDSDGVPINRGGHRADLTQAIGLLTRRVGAPESTADAAIAPGERIAVESLRGATPRGRFVARGADTIRLQVDGVSEGQVAELVVGCYPRLYRGATTL